MTIRRTWVLVASSVVAACAARGPQPRAQRIALSPEPTTQELLTGEPQTRGMRSGRVVLGPGDAMRRHSTRDNEELLVFLSGRATVVLGSERVEMAGGEVLYIPPDTEHEVQNDGTAEARYIYTVAPVRR